MVTRGARLARGLLAAFFAVATAALSHSVAGATVPSFPALILSLILAAAVCVALAAKPLSAGHLAGAVAVSQLGFHLLFAFFGAAPASAGTAGLGQLHHAHHLAPQLGGLVFAPASAGSAELHTAHGNGGAALLMWLAHGLAAAVTYLLLRFGERAVAVCAAAVSAQVHAWLSRMAQPSFLARPITLFTHRRIIRAIGALRTALLGSRGPPWALIHP